MAIKALQKPVRKEAVETKVVETNADKVDKFISKGGTLAADPVENQAGDSTDHRLTLRIPKQLMDRVDAKRKQRVGKISRNLWILEVIEKASKD